MSAYAGNDTYAASTTIPDPNNPADASSVDVPLEDLADRSTFLLKRMAAHAESQAPLEWETYDGQNIEFGPVYGVVSFDTAPRYMQIATPTVLTVAHIEGGIAPVGSSNYYVYMYWAGAPRFELSLTVPDAFKLYKSTAPDRVLVGIVQTDSTAKWTPMRATRHTIRYLKPSIIKLAGANPTLNVIDLSLKLPPIARTAWVSVNGRNGGPLFNAYVAVGPGDYLPNGMGGYAPVDPKLFRKLNLPVLVNGWVDTDIEIPLGHTPTAAPYPGNDRKIFCITDSATSSMEILLTGFKL